MAMTRSQKAARRAGRKGTVRGSLYPQFEREAAVKHHKPQEDVRIIALDARCRHNGRSDRKEMAGPMWGDPAGRAIAIGAGTPSIREALRETAQTADGLWETFKEMDAADEAYFRRIIGRPRFPNVAKLEYIGEAFGTRADDHPKRSRTEEEKDGRAVSRWMQVQDNLVCLSANEHSAIVAAMRQRVMLTHGGRLTGAGAAFVHALVRYDRLARRGLTA